MAKEQPVKRATGQVERATRDLSEWEKARSRQADLSELDAGKPVAEGEAVPTSEAGSDKPGRSAAGETDVHGQRGSGPESARVAREGEEADDPERASSTAKPITVHNQDQ